MSKIGHYTALQLLLKHRPTGFVVDVGAFPGTLTRMLAGAGYQVLALDKGPDRGVTIQENFQFGRDYAQNEQTFAEAMRAIGVDTRAADIELAAMPVESGTVDAVVLTEVIEHLFVNPLFCLTEINRILKPGGMLLLSTPNLRCIKNRIAFARGDMATVIEDPFSAFLMKLQLGHCGHVRTYDPDEIRAMLDRLGFESEFHFRSFDFWDPGPGEPSLAGPAAPTKKPAMWRKFIRSPASYWRAGLATIQAVLEKRIPHLRPHMFVVARKGRDVTMNDLMALRVAVQR